MSLLYRSSFNHQLGEFTDLNNCSSPTSFLDFQSSDDFRYFGSPTPGMEESIMGIFVKQETEDCAVNNDRGIYGISENCMEDSLDVHTTNMNLNPNLARHNSSPPGFFSNQGVENGGFNQVHLGQLKDENGASSSPKSRTKYMNFGSSNESSCNILKRLVDNNDQISFSSLNSGLTRGHSLPKTASDFLKFKGSPCNLRAKRGFATHPRSIAERVRRTRISERMRKLQKLFPNLDKQANTSDMLDMAVEYIKDLQKQVKNLAESKSKCNC